MKFAVGEMVLLYSNPDSLPEYSFEGLRVEIVGNPKGWFYWNRFGEQVDVDYKIRMPDGDVLVAQECELRQIPPETFISASTLALFTKKQPNPDKVKETERG